MMQGFEYALASAINPYPECQGKGYLHNFTSNLDDLFNLDL